MTLDGEPIIESTQERRDIVKISFKPDLKRFKMSRLDDDTVALLKKRVYDIAGFTGKKIRVMLNGEKIPISDFKE